MRANAVIVLVTAWLLAVANAGAWKLLAALDPGTLGRPLFLLCLGTLLAFSIALVLLPFSFRWAMKPWLVVVLLLAGSAAFFVDDIGAVIDRHTLRGVFETDAREAGEWLSWHMAWKIGFTGVLPALLVAWTRIQWQPWRRELIARARLILALLVACALSIGIGGRGIASGLRNQREIGHLINPMAIVSAALAYLDNARPHAAIVVAPIGRDARLLPRAANARPRLFVFIAGESVRAASWGLNPGAPDTTPELRALGVMNFAQVTSCGTDTAVSLPCMFSDLGRKNFSERKALARENALDVLQHAGIQVHWYDNNTGSKSIARRVGESDLQTSTDARFCTAKTCLDAILLNAFTAALSQSVQGDRTLVLHLKGSHGPAYYERYPPAFERFRPVCRSNQLQGCTREAIRNTYHNTIAYTDHLIAQMIAQLAARSDFDSALLFVSDHGESTGESGLYLHGTPYALAPDLQTHIPMVLWLSDGFAASNRLDRGCVTAQATKPWSHDNVFDLTLGLNGVATRAYRPRLDPLAPCRVPN